MTMAMTTTTGTRPLWACLPAATVYVGSFLNLRATADIIDRRDCLNLLVVCSGTFEEAAYEDVLGAGALCDLLWTKYNQGVVSDSAQLARRLYSLEQNYLLGAVAQTRNGRRLMSNPQLREDVGYCVQRDLLRGLAELGKDGVVRYHKWGL